MSEGFDIRFRPVEIKYSKADKELTVTWDDGKTFVYPAEFLRVESPSAEVQGHGPDQRVTVPGRMHVGIMAIEPIGNYAVRIAFDDMHDTGIYSWPYLRKIGEEKDRIWAEYVAALQAQGLSRDPRAGKIG